MMWILEYFEERKYLSLGIYQTDIFAWMHFNIYKRFQEVIIYNICVLYTWYRLNLHKSFAIFWLRAHISQNEINFRYINTRLKARCPETRCWFMAWNLYKAFLWLIEIYCLKFCSKIKIYTPSSLKFKRKFKMAKKTFLISFLSIRVSFSCHCRANFRKRKLIHCNNITKHLRPYLLLPAANLGYIISEIWDELPRKAISYSGTTKLW